MSADDLIRRGDVAAALEVGFKGLTPFSVLDAIAALPAVAAPGVRLPTVDELSNIIRAVDGKHNLGAGELAARILAAIDTPAPALMAELVEAAKALEKAASHVSNLGAVTGPQWSKLTVACLKARAVLAKIGGA